jgi:hypothetical protein
LKTIVRFIASLVTCFALASPLPAAAYDQAWNDCCVGPINSFGLLALTASPLAMPGLTSSTPGWTEFGNSNAAFATFAPTTSLYFDVHILSSSGTFAVFAWNDGVLVDSGLLNTSNVVLSEPYAGPLPFKDMADFKSMAAPVPEPGSYLMVLAGLAVMGLIVRRRMGNAA